MTCSREFLGELLSTFALALFGCGSVVLSALFVFLQGLLQVALVWGIGVNLAIYLTRQLACSSPAGKTGRDLSLKRGNSLTLSSICYQGSSINTGAVRFSMQRIKT